jgi:hypothetical protein
LPYLEGEMRECGNKHAPRTSTLVQSPNARLRPAKLERGAVFREGAAMRELNLKMGEDGQAMFFSI